MRVISIHEAHGCAKEALRCRDMARDMTDEQVQATLLRMATEFERIAGERLKAKRLFVPASNQPSHEPYPKSETGH